MGALPPLCVHQKSSIMNPSIPNHEEQGYSNAEQIPLPKATEVHRRKKMKTSHEQELQIFTDFRLFFHSHAFWIRNSSACAFLAGGCSGRFVIFSVCLYVCLLAR